MTLLQDAVLGSKSFILVDNFMPFGEENFTFLSNLYQLRYLKCTFVEESTTVRPNYFNYKEIPGQVHVFDSKTFV